MSQEGSARAGYFRGDRLELGMQYAYRIDNLAQVLREQVRVTRPGGIVSAVACFCHTDGLPHYHGRYPLPGNHQADELYYKLWQVFRRFVRPGLLGVDTSILNQELLWEFKAAGLEQVQIEGHLTLVSPGDARIPLDDAGALLIVQGTKPAAMEASNE